MRMSTPWQVGAGGDLAARIHHVGRVHSAFLAGRPVEPGSSGTREVVLRSWARSARAGVDLDGTAQVVLADGDLADCRAAHPLARVIGVLRELVGGPAGEAGHLMAVSDAVGRLLWVEGHRGECRRAERMNFVEGAAWDEQHAGTNAPGTALTLDQPVQIIATEHFRHQVQGWTCAAAPIHDPATRQILGVIDVTGGDVVAHPHSLSLVRAAARTAEYELAAPRGVRSPSLAADPLALVRVHAARGDLPGARTLLREIDEELRRRPGLGTLAGEAGALRAQLANERGSGVPGASALTAAELRLLPLLSTHLSVPEIAAELFLSPHTIKSQMKSIYRKLNATTRNQAVTQAREQGLLEG